jgi:hypothetical protein
MRTQQLMSPFDAICERRGLTTQERILFHRFTQQCGRGVNSSTYELEILLEKWRKSLLQEVSTVA